MHLMLSSALFFYVFGTVTVIADSFVSTKVSGQLLSKVSGGAIHSGSTKTGDDTKDGYYATSRLLLLFINFMIVH